MSKNMKKITEYIQDSINEAKEYFYNKNNIVVYGGDHYFDRSFDRSISEDLIRENIKKFSSEIIEISKTKQVGYEFVIRNKNIHPYLNIVLQFSKLENNKSYFVIKTIMKNFSFKTSNDVIEKYK